jgi:hypothetical protein
MEQETKNPSYEATQEEKLKAIIEKAEKAGWNPFSFNEMRYALHRFDVGNKDLPLDSIFFDHDFAKAFWQHPEHCDIPESFCSRHASWQYHIQQLVLTQPEERIDYLYKFLNE